MYSSSPEYFELRRAQSRNLYSMSRRALIGGGSTTAAVAVIAAVDRFVDIVPERWQPIVLGAASTSLSIAMGGLIAGRVSGRDEARFLQLSEPLN